MTTTLYPRNLTAYVGGRSGATLSARGAPTAQAAVAQDLYDLIRTTGSTDVQVQLATLANTSPQTFYFGKWVSRTLLADVAANTWTISLAASESNLNVNAFLQACGYVLKEDGTVRGYVYDPAVPAGLGAEFANGETGVVRTVAGAAVAGVARSDVLVWELWAMATQGAATARTISEFYGGTAAITDGVATSSAGATISTPQDGLVTPYSVGVPVGGGFG